MSDKARVYEYLKNNGPKTLDELESALGLARYVLRGRLSMLKSDGMVSTDSNKKDKKYSAVEQVIAQ